LSQHELTVLALLGNESPDGESPALLNSVRNASEKAGLNQLAFNLALRGLRAKGFTNAEDVFYPYDNERYDGIRLSDSAWAWIEQNVSKFTLYSRPPSKTKAPNLSDMNEDIPF
ncbi:MAG: hypothetical protein GX776_03525, partial [Oxalobacter sp.]|nr:hypothetical protein [Oxalobacter sp.]